jgi:acyl carrier protein
MDNTAALKQEIKRLMVENLMLQATADEIGDDQPLFGPGSLGLDSVDALQLVVALDKTYGLKIADPEIARRTLQSVTSIASAVTGHNNSLPASGHSAPAKGDGLDGDQSIRIGS